MLSISIWSVLASAACAYAQNPPQQPSVASPPEAVEIVTRAPELLIEPKDITDAQRTSLNTVNKTFQALTAGHGTRRSYALKKLQNMKLITNTEARDRILAAKDPTRNPPDERFIGDIANYRLIQKYKPVISALFERSKMFGSGPNGPVRYFGHSDIRFASFSGQTMMIQSRSTEVAFDSSTTDAKTRARSAVEELVLPSIKDFQEAMKADGIDWYAVHLTYGTRDVKKERAADEVSESVLVAWTKDSGSAYLEGKLSAVEFMQISLIVHSNRNVISVTRLAVEDAKPAK